MMYIRKLVLRDVRCIEYLEMEFASKKRSALILGDNGSGKSTILRALAIGVCDQSSSAALFRELTGNFIRSGQETGSIQIELQDKRVRYKITTTFKGIRNFERLDQNVKKFNVKTKRFRIINTSEFPWEHIFVTAYGPGVRTQGTSDFDLYSTINAVYPLFVYDMPLQNPELVVRRLIDYRRTTQKKGFEYSSQKILSLLKTLLASLLSLREGERIQLRRSGIELEGNWGNAQLTALGDGYRSMMTWVLDLIGWWFLFGDSSVTKYEPLNVQGIVLIDEVEQHLHPIWQRSVMPDLVRGLPNVQFIATTHSPLTASSTDSVQLFQVAGGSVRETSAYGWLAEDVYRMMGLEEGSRYGSFTTQVLVEFDALDMKRIDRGLTKLERRKYDSLLKKLNALPVSDPSKLTIELRNIAKLTQDGKERQ